MFGTFTNETIPDNIVHSYEAWDEYMSAVWKSLIQPIVTFTSQSTVIEIAPGTSTKIASALQQLDFCGTLWIVEPSVEISSQVVAKYQAILPKARVQLIMKYLAEAVQELPENADLLVSNHALDDMLIAQGTSNREIKKELFEWATDPQRGLEDIFRRSWAILVKNKTVLHQAKQAVYHEIHSAIQALFPQHVIFSQYASLVLNHHQIHELNHHAQDIMKALKETYFDRSIADPILQSLLNAHKNYNDPHIGNEVLNARNWMAL